MLLFDVQRGLRVTWYADNAARDAPLASRSTGEGAGDPLPDGFLVDLTVAFPGPPGCGAYVSAARGGPAAGLVVSRVEPDGSPGPGLLALGASGGALRAGNRARLEPLAAGASGEAAFGPAAGEPFAAGPSVAGGRLAPAAVRVLPPAPVPSLGAAGSAAAFSGDVLLLGAGGVEVVRAVRPVGPDGADAECLVVRLSGPAVAAGALRDYAPACAAATLAGGCDRPPVRSLGGAVADAAGGVGLRWDFEPGDPDGGAVGPAPGGGLELSLPHAVADVCPPGPDPDGRLPGPAPAECPPDDEGPAPP